MELKEGMYCRTKNGIAKITTILCGEDLYFDSDNLYDDDEKEIFKYNPPSKECIWTKNNIQKASYNIIDLIEVGDYVNGEKVTDSNDNHYLCFGNYDYYITNSKDIKTVLTKEQMEQMKYEVE